MKKLTLLMVLFVQFISAQELALVKQGDKFGYITKAGEYAILPKFKDAKNFSEGMAYFR
ncbi:WG repeat-containing protein [Flavobacterium piscinae]|uniref:WG repeat-containing protein n=1 Tax=Flavobacterium piscinae TaxID=2506424 RepID=UPI002AAC490E|nr:WG repeat-containing protein [Flavobacterium piscinae]